MDLSVRNDLHWLDMDQAMDQRMVDHNIYSLADHGWLYRCIDLQTTEIQ